MTRRAVAALLALLTVTAGCSAITGQPTTFTASDVSVSEAAKSDTGYSLQNRSTQRIERTFAGQKVVVSNKLAEYARTVEAPVFGDTKIARFTVFATPAVEVAGQGPFNPVADLNNTQLVLRLQAQYEAVSNVRFESNRTQTMLGQETTVSKFRADARTVGGTQVEVFIHITKVQHGDDFVLAVAVHPTRVEEQQKVNAMLRGVQHAGSGGSGDGGGDSTPTGGNDGAGGGGTPTDGGGATATATPTATATDDGIV